MKQMVYSLLEEGNIVMQGTAKEIAKALKITNYNSVTQCCKRNQRLRRKYTLEFIGYKDDAKTIKHLNDLQWIKIALLNHSLTSYHNNGDEFVEELKAEGIQFTATPCPYKKGHYYLKRI